MEAVALGLDGTIACPLSPRSLIIHNTVKHFSLGFTLTLAPVSIDNTVKKEYTSLSSIQYLTPYLNEFVHHLLDIMIFLQWGSTICNDPPAQCNAQMKAPQHCIECSGINYSCAQRNTVQRSEEPGAVNQNTFHCGNTAVQKIRCSDQRFSF